MALLQQYKDPLTAKILTWIYATDPEIQVRATELIRFLKENPSWPRQHILRQKVEKNAAGVLGKQETLLWFSQNPPETSDGIRLYLAALGNSEVARHALSSFWKTASLGRNEASALTSVYAGWFSKDAHIARLDHLIWQERLSEAEAMLAFVPGDFRALGHARIALARIARDADNAVGRVPQHLQNDEGLLFERLRYRRRKNMDAGAMEIARRIPKNSAHGDIWWKELNILARREIEQRNYARAYDISSRHGMTAGPDFAQAEWTLGWLALKMKRNAEALAHFERMHQEVQSALSKSRAAYWAARAAEKGGNKEKERAWEAVAAQYPSSFYGQLSHTLVRGKPVASVFTDPPVPQAARNVFEQNELVRAARLLHRAGLISYLDSFLARIVGDAKTKDDYRLAARLAMDLNVPYYAVQANKDAQQKIGVFLFDEGYPLLESSPQAYPEKALVHAIIYRESMFNSQARSSAGALGLMQLMPATARETARKLGKAHTTEKLTGDPRHNVILGSAYLQQMVDRFGGFYPMAIASYNAGPGRVNQWIEEFGDPRDGNIDVVDWVEHIPIYETRNYVQRVMESYYIYRLKFNQTPRTIKDFEKK